MAKLEQQLDINNELERQNGQLLIDKYFPNSRNPLTNSLIQSWRVIKPSGEILTAEDIFNKTGIRLRYVAAQETVLDMGIKAAEKALKGDKEIDFCLVSTSFPVGVNVASEIVQALELPKVIPYNPDCVMDIYAACAGFVRGIDFLKKNEAKFLGKRILFISTEKYSDKVADLRQTRTIEADPSLAQTLFSDGAVALVFRLGQDLEILSSETHRLDQVRNLIQMPLDESLMVEPYIYEGVDRSLDYFRQQGPRVFKEISYMIPRLTEQWLQRAQIGLDEVGGIITHQGSGRMVTHLRDQFGRLFQRDIPVAYDMEEGNFSSASVPKAWERLVREDTLDQKKVMLLIGFGAGVGLLASVAAVTLKGGKNDS